MGTGNVREPRAWLRGARDSPGIQDGAGEVAKVLEDGHGVLQLQDLLFLVLEKRQGKTENNLQRGRSAASVAPHRLAAMGSWPLLAWAAPHLGGSSSHQQTQIPACRKTNPQVVSSKLQPRQTSTDSLLRVSVKWREKARMRARESSLLSAGSLPKGPRWPGQGWAAVRSPGPSPAASQGLHRQGDGAGPCTRCPNRRHGVSAAGLTHLPGHNS